MNIDFAKIKRDDIRSVIQSLLTKDPDLRASIESLRNTDWVTHNGTEEIDLTKAEFVPEGSNKKEVEQCSTPTHSFGNY